MLPNGLKGTTSPGNTNTTTTTANIAGSGAGAGTTTTGAGIKLTVDPTTYRYEPVQIIERSWFASHVDDVVVGRFRCLSVGNVGTTPTSTSTQVRSQPQIGCVSKYSTGNERLNEIKPLHPHYHLHLYVNPLHLYINRILPTTYCEISNANPNSTLTLT